jgi:hypothetical protein
MNDEYLKHDLKKSMSNIGIKLNNLPTTSQEKTECLQKLNRFHANQRSVLNEPRVELR